MKIAFIVLGLLFLGGAFAYSFATSPESRLAGGVQWRCEPPTETDKNSHCYTEGGSDTFMRIDVEEIPITLCLGMTGIAFMAAAPAFNKLSVPAAAQGPAAGAPPYPQQPNLQHQQRMGPPQAGPPSH